MPAPVALFVYNRPDHTRRTLEALRANELAEETSLHVFSDGPKAGATQEDLDRIAAVRAIVREQRWCGSVTIEERDSNVGLAASIVDGITRVVEVHERVVVLEDDIVAAPGFLRFMNDALDLYAADERVMHVSGYMHDVDLTPDLGDTFFYNVTTCWGWATWSRAWRNYESNAHTLLEALADRHADLDVFNGGQGTSLYDQLLANAGGQLDTWAVKWHASVFLHEGVCLHPRNSTTTNIGHDGSGVHCVDSGVISAKLAPGRVRVLPRAEVEAATATHSRVSEAFAAPGRSSRRTSRFAGAASGLRSRLRRLAGRDSAAAREIARLRQLPRYQPGVSTLLGEPFEFVDALTFVEGVAEILRKEIYDFQSSNPAPRIIDCGANIGLSVLFFKTRYPDARVVAVEPDPHIFEALSRNVETLGLQNVEVRRQAVWTAATSVPFRREGGFSGRIPKRGDGPQVEVEGVTLAELVGDHDVDFLKLDIEGAEFEVLATNPDVLAGVQNVFVEYHSHCSEDQNLGELLVLLKRAGFRYHVQEALQRVRPYVDRRTIDGMDSQANVFAYRR